MGRAKGKRRSRAKIRGKIRSFNRKKQKAKQLRAIIAAMQEESPGAPLFGCEICKEGFQYEMQAKSSHRYHLKGCSRWSLGAMPGASHCLVLLHYAKQFGIESVWCAMLIRLQTLRCIAQKIAQRQILH